MKKQARGMAWRACALLAAVAAGWWGEPAPGQIQLPIDFAASPISPVMDEPVGMAFAPDGRLFVAEKKGIVWVLQDGAVISKFIDLRQEVNAQGDRGLLGIALEPDFINGRHVWLLLTVDPAYGEPDESANDPVIGRLLRYQGTSASGGNVAGVNSRKVVLGNSASDGIPICWSSHGIGTVRAAADGSVFVGAGDGARFEFVDSGGQTDDCLINGIIDPSQDIGAFRAQNLNSLSGKILRIDGITGEGLPDNPFWTGNPLDNQSRVWTSGLRNPFRFCVKPGTSPGTLLVGDVGWNDYEEVSASSPAGGDNFGWPCFEGFSDTPEYPAENPANSGCGTIGTPGNPGNLTAPVLSWHHSQQDLSIPPGVIGSAGVGGAFSSGTAYPVPYRNGLFIADFIQGWVKLAKLDDANQLTALAEFGDNAGQPVDFAINPITGNLCYVSLENNRIYEIRYLFNVADINEDGSVNIDDLLAVINGWGPCNPPKALIFCPSDVTDNGATDIDDLLMIINNWG